MQQRILIACFLLFLLSATHAHNITQILANHPSFSTFNSYLTTTHLAEEINRRRTITVCAVDNAAMNELTSKHFPVNIIKNVLSLHVFADYFGEKKLREVSKGSTTTSTLFQATGEAAGISGFVTITDVAGEKVGFNPVGSGSEEPIATFVKSIEEIPYVISVVQISHILSSPEAEAPLGAPVNLNITSAAAPKAGKAKGKKHDDAPEPSDDDGDVADEDSIKAGSHRVGAGGAFLSLIIGILYVIL